MKQRIARRHDCYLPVTGKTENANNPHGEGSTDQDNFAPFPKNPAIAKFFMQLGRVEELGSGVLNVNRFIKEYSGTDSPQFIEGPIFKMVIPVSEGINGLSEGINITTEGIKSVIEAVFPKIRDDAQQNLTIILFEISKAQGIRVAQLSNITGVAEKSIERYIEQLKKGGLIEFKGARKTGGYFVTEKISENN